jgi:hypothetical protein
LDKANSPIAEPLVKDVPELRLCDIEFYKFLSLKAPLDTFETVRGVLLGDRVIRYTTRFSF